MDELTAALAGSFQVSYHPNNPDAPHPKFQNLYKLKGTVLDQRERRRRALQQQKKGRFDQLSHVRRLADDVWDGGADEYFAESMETAPPAHRKPGRRYKSQLMFSEWMLEVPENFEKDYVMIPCPVGKRNLVIASGGITYSYAKSGHLINQFSSWLPGGNRQQGYHKQSEVTILDCVFVENMKTFFVLDLMCWKTHPIYDTETEFRLFWLNSQFSEIPQLANLSKANTYKFVALPNFACDKENLEGVMLTPMTTPLDGLLFYHKLTHYTFGPTPLVLWLKAYMMPEILDIKIALYHMAQQPGTYKGFASHVEQVKQENSEGSGKSKKKYGGTAENRTPGMLDPGSFPRDLRYNNRPMYNDNPTHQHGTNHRRTRTSSGGASQKQSSQKSHNPARSPGAQPTVKILQRGQIDCPSVSEGGFTFGAQDVRYKQDASLTATSPSASAQAKHSENEKMEGVQVGPKKKGKGKKKKGRKSAASMDM